MMAVELPSLPVLGRGTRIGERYVVQRLLGEGGMGQVYEVVHEALGRGFALKILRLDAADAERVRRFHREARALAAVRSPRVVQVTDFGVDDAVGPFYVMDLLEGATLDVWLAKHGPMSVAEGLDVVCELADALAEIHAAGIVHRDLKPSNIGFAPGSAVRVKLLDFGLARGHGEESADQITRSNQVIGSMPYIAPEQFRGEPISPAIDQYALGIVLYECITGRPPFHADVPAALIHQHLSAPVPPLPLAHPDHAFATSVLARLLAKAKTHRFPDAASIAVEIRAYRATHPVAIPVEASLPTTAWRMPQATEDSARATVTRSMAQASSNADAASAAYVSAAAVEAQRRRTVARGSPRFVWVAAGALALGAVLVMTGLGVGAWHALRAGALSDGATSASGGSTANRALVSATPVNVPSVTPSAPGASTTTAAATVPSTAPAGPRESAPAASAASRATGGLPHPPTTRPARLPPSPRPRPAAAGESAAPRQWDGQGAAAWDEP